MDASADSSGGALTRPRSVPWLGGENQASFRDGNAQIAQIAQGSDHFAAISLAQAQRGQFSRGSHV
jgi:hypothetical protein